MQKFTYNQTISETQNIVKERKRKINRQRIIYLIAFFVLLASFIVYVVDRLYWVNFDGYIKTNAYEVRMMDDIFITEITVETGQQVKQGDILFYFLYTTGTLGSFSNNNPIVNRDKQTINSQQSIALKESTLASLRDQIRLLERLIVTTRDQIFLGVSTQADLKNYNNELRSLKLRAEITEKELKIEREFLGSNSSYLRTGDRIGGWNIRDSIIDYTLPSKLTLADFGHVVPLGAIIPYLAKFEGTIIDIQNGGNSMCYQKESVLSMQADNAELLNLHVDCLIPLNKIHLIQEGDEVEVIIAKKRSHKAKVELIGTISKEIPKHLQQPFERNVTAIDARVKFIEPEKLEFWECTTDVPVIIRKPRTKSIIKKF